MLEEQCYQVLLSAPKISSALVGVWSTLFEYLFQLKSLAKALSVDLEVLLPTTTEDDAALHEDNNCFKYDSDEECEIEED